MRGRRPPEDTGRPPGPPGEEDRSVSTPRFLTAARSLFILDTLASLLVWCLFLRFGCAGASCLAAPADPATAAIFPVTNLLGLYALGLYRRDAVIDTRGALRRVPMAVAIGASGALVLTMLLAPWIGVAPNLPSMAAASVLGFAVAAAVMRLVFSTLRDRGVFRRRLLLIGAGARAWDLVWLLRKEGRMPHYDVSFLHDDRFGAVDERLRIEHPGRIARLDDDQVLHVAHRLQTDQIVVAPDERRGVNLEQLLACKAAGFPVTEYLTFLEHEIRRVDVKRIEVGWLLYSPGFTFGTIDAVLKRTLDLVVSAILLVIFTPVLFGAAIAIKLGDRGPIFYSQERVTSGERRFRIHKLRTMRTDAEKAGAVWAATGDPRVTRVGSFLRKTRIDELPQLWNVLRGEMSIVGPRPERPEFVRNLAAQLPLYHERHRVKAGLTGWAQINYPYGASIDDARSKLSYDLYYVKNFSILFDMLIILQTLRVVLTRSGAR